ncbi:unnamed protein product [Sphagnum balticum]
MVSREGRHQAAPRPRPPALQDWQRSRTAPEGADTGCGAVLPQEEPAGGAAPPLGDAAQPGEGGPRVLTACFGADCAVIAVLRDEAQCRLIAIGIDYRSQGLRHILELFYGGSEQLVRPDFRTLQQIEAYCQLLKRWASILDLGKVVPDPAK